MLKVPQTSKMRAGMNPQSELLLYPDLSVLMSTLLINRARG